MGIAIAVSYLGALAVASAIALALSIIPIRFNSSRKTSLAKKAFAYTIGVVISVSVTTTYAWWNAIHATNEWEPVIGSLVISLAGPILVGVILLLVWLGVRGFNFSSLAYIPFGAFHAIVAMPIVGILYLAYYDDVFYKPTFTGLCVNAQSVILEEITPARSVAFLPDYFKTSNAKGQGSKYYTGRYFVQDYQVDFVESRGPATDLKLVRLTLESLPTEPSNSPKIESTPIDEITAEYKVVASKLAVPKEVADRMHGQRIDVQRVSDNKLIAYTQYYWDSNKFWECPIGISKSNYLFEFLLDALRVDKR